MRPAVCLAVDASRVESKQAKDNQSGQLLAAQLIKTLLLALAAGQLQAASRGVEAAQLAPAPAPANATGKPLWHRPGCYQVGHTRTISIPGCVKFNLSTNACRGFCLSFSIPAAEDIGPAGGPPGLPPAERAQAVTLAGNSLASDFANTDRMMKRAGNSAGAQARSGGGDEQLQGQQQHQQQPQQPKLFQDFHQIASSALRQPGESGTASEKRDVISVGQCCNMMETEDVTVNLRCGFNETRRLVFKSAKTCECFFCKHV